MKELEIVFENEDFFVVNKPFGLASQGGARISRSLDDILRRQTGCGVFLAHRLDKDTSGLLAAAKSSKAAGDLGKSLSAKSAKKIYTAICFGNPAQKKGVWTDKISSKGSFLAAETEFCEVGRASLEKNGEKFSICVLSISIRSGRTHQIRIHCASHGAPIVADDKCGDFSANKAFAKAFGANKMCLASTALAFEFRGERFDFSIPLPAHMKKICTFLQNAV